MKKILLVPVALCSFFYGFSQSYTQGVDEKLQLLNKSEIGTHILYDRVYPMAYLQASTSISEKNRFMKYKLSEITLSLDQIKDR